MEKWTAIGVSSGMAAFLIGMSLLIFATRPTPYESYNNAIEQCMVLKDKQAYETCLVSVNSGYTRMINNEKYKNGNNH